MKKILMLQVLLILVFSNAGAQIDWIKDGKAGLAAAKTGADSIKPLLDLSTGYASVKDYKTALRYADQALFISLRSATRTPFAKSLLAKGTATYGAGQHDKGREMLRDALSVVAEYPAPDMTSRIATKYSKPMIHDGKVVIGTPDMTRDIPDQPLAADSDIVRLNIHAILFETYKAEGRMPECIPELVAMQRLAERGNQALDAAWAAGQLGRIYFNLGSFSEAYHSIQEERAIAEKNGLKDVEADALYRLASLYSTLGDFPKSVECHQKVIALFDSLGKADAAAAARSNLGQVYGLHQDYDRALVIFRQSSETAEKTGNAHLLAANLHNIAEILSNKGDKAAALISYRAALHLNDSLHDNKFIVQNYLGLGRLFRAATQFDSAEYYFAKGRRLSESQGFKEENAAVANDFGRLYLEKSRRAESKLKHRFLDSSIIYLTDAVTRAEAIGHEGLLQAFYGDLSEAYKANGDYKASMEFLEKATAIKDSLFSQQNAFRIARLENDASMAQKDNEISTSRAEASGLRKQRLFWYGGGLLLVVIATGGFFIYRNQRRRKEQLLKAEFRQQVSKVEMQALRAQMNPHFIFNCLNSINHYIVKSDRITATGYLTKFSKLIRLILDNSAVQAATLENEIQLLRLYIEMECLRYDNHFTWKIEIDEGLDPETLQLPSMLIQPYIENAIWHGLMHQKKEGVLSIQVRQFSGSLLEVIIEDNGIGRKRSAEIKAAEVLEHKSYGLRITQDRLQMISSTYKSKADVTIEDLVNEDGLGRGTKVTLHIPFQTLTVPQTL